MQQVLLLSPADRATIESSLNRLIGNAYGAMATLPLYCLGELHALNPASLVTDRYDVWHSYLIMIREVLRSASSLDNISPTLDALFGTVNSLRDAFLELISGRTLDSDKARAAYNDLVSAYDHLVLNTIEIIRDLELQEQILPAENSLKRVCFERSLRWFGDELRAKATAARPE